MGYCGRVGKLAILSLAALDFRPILLEYPPVDTVQARIATNTSKLRVQLWDYNKQILYSPHLLAVSGEQVKIVMDENGAFLCFFNLYRDNGQGFECHYRNIDSLQQMDKIIIAQIVVVAVFCFLLLSFIYLRRRLGGFRTFAVRDEARQSAWLGVCS